MRYLSVLALSVIAVVCVLFVTVSDDADASDFSKYTHWDEQDDGTYHADIFIKAGHRCLSIIDNNYSDIVLVVGSDIIRPESIVPGVGYWEVDYTSDRSGYFMTESNPSDTSVWVGDSEFKGIRAASEYDLPYDTFSVEPGILTVNQNMYNLFLNVGGSLINPNRNGSESSLVFDIPSHSDSAFFYTNTVRSPASVYFDIEYTIETMEYESKIIADSNYHSVFHLEKGNYQMTFAADGYLASNDSSFSSTFFTAGVSKTVYIEKDVDVFFRTSENVVYVSCTISPNILSEKASSTTEWTDVTGAAYYKWFSTDMELSAGTHSMNIYGYAWYAFPKGSQEQIDFENEVAIPGAHIDKKWRSDIYVEQSTVFTVYVLVEYYSKSVYLPSGYLDNESIYPDWKAVNNQEWVSLYLGYNSASDIAVKYDDSKYYAVLFNGSGNMALVSEYLYNISTASAREYWILLIPIDDSASMVEAEFSVYASNTEKSDDMGIVFAVSCIVLCAILFGLLGYATRKPAWQK